MEGKISLRTAGIIAGAAAIFAFLFGLIISASITNFANRSEASPEKPTPIPLVSEEGESPFTRIAEIVSPAVVNISAERMIKTEMPGFEWEFRGPFEDFFRDFFKNFPKFEGKSQTLGSGFIISEDGYAVTNYHVIKDASNIVFKLPDKREYKGDKIKIIGTDRRTDLALLKIEDKGKFPYLKFGDTDKIKIGDWVVAVGNPFSLEGTVTVGVISAKGRSNIPLAEGPDFQSFLQTDAAINPGNSGGPLVNIHGEVVGINTAITTTTGGSVGIGFAIPANLAKMVIDELKTKGKVMRGYLGIYLQEITEDLKDGLGLPSLEGVLISEVLDKTPASRAGLKNGDVILEFDGKKVVDVQSFRIQVASTPVGNMVKMKIFRNGKDKEIDIKVGEAPEEIAGKPETEEEALELGLKVVDVSDPRSKSFDLKIKSGVVVVEVKPGSTAEDAGITVGDVITQIDKQEIKNLTDYRRAVANLKKGKPIIFQIQKGERKRYIAVTP